MRGLLAMALLACAGGAQAVPFGLYQLGSHPDAAQSPPPYGLRLDGLFGPAGNIWTFDFSDAQSSMSLRYNPDDSLRIFGTTLGGRDSGSGYAAGTVALFDIDFTYTGVSEKANGGLDDTRDINGFDDFGTITRQSDSAVVALRDHGRNSGGATGLSFQLGDEGGGGHRGFNGISGWGWLDHGSFNSTPGDFQNVSWETNEPSVTGCCNDWLFTATPVPAPATLPLVVLGLLGAAGSLRRVESRRRA